MLRNTVGLFGLFQHYKGVRFNSGGPVGGGGKMSKKKCYVVLEWP